MFLRYDRHLEGQSYYSCCFDALLVLQDGGDIYETFTVWRPNSPALADVGITPSCFIIVFHLLVGGYRMQGLLGSSNSR